MCDDVCACELCEWECVTQRVFIEEGIENSGT